MHRLRATHRPRRPPLPVRLLFLSAQGCHPGARTIPCDTTDKGLSLLASLKTAILGCGGRAVGHAEAYAAGVPTGSLVACCDMNEKSLDAFVGRFGIPERYTDLSEMLRKVKPDLLHVVTRPRSGPPCSR